MALNAPHIEFYVSNGPTYDTANFTATFTLKCRGKAADSASAVRWYLDGILYGSSLYRSGSMNTTNPATVLGGNYYEMADLRGKRYSATLNASTFTDFNWAQDYTIYYDTLLGNPIPNQYYSVIWANPYNKNADVPIHTGHTLGVDEGYINLHYTSSVVPSESTVTWHQYFYNDTDGATQIDLPMSWSNNPWTRFREFVGQSWNTVPNDTIMRCLLSGVRTLANGGGGYVALDSIPVTHPYSLWIPGEVEEGCSNIDFLRSGDLKVADLIESSNLNNFSFNKQSTNISINELIEY